MIALGPAGRFLLGLVAIGLAGYALWCLVRTVFDPDRLGRGAKGIVARAGYAALAVIFAEIGAFLVVAALRRDPGEARGLGGALATLSATHPAGPLLLGIVAFGLIAFGIFSLAEARCRRIGPV